MLYPLCCPAGFPISGGFQVGAAQSLQGVIKLLSGGNRSICQYMERFSFILEHKAYHQFSIVAEEISVVWLN